MVCKNHRMGDGRRARQKPLHLAQRLGLGCRCLPERLQSAAALEFFRAERHAKSTHIDADLKDATVTPGAPNEKTGALPPGVANITSTWKEATEEALARAAIFNDDSHRHVNLEVKILKFDVPGAGFTFPTYTDARYTLVDRKTGDVLFSQLVSGEGETPMDYAFIGAIRARESINRSAQSNIGNFLISLEHGSVATAQDAHPSTSDAAHASW